MGLIEENQREYGLWTGIIRVKDEAEGYVSPVQDNQFFSNLVASHPEILHRIFAFRVICHTQDAIFLWDVEIIEELVVINIYIHLCELGIKHMKR